MTSGTHLTLDDRVVLVHQVRQGDWNVDWLLNTLFYGRKISRDYLERLCVGIAAMSEKDIHSYLHPAAAGTRGRKRKLPEGSDADNYLQHIQKKHRTMTVRSLFKKFVDDFYRDPLDAPSLSSVNRAVGRVNTRKKVHFKNIKRSPAEQLEYLEKIAHVSADRIIDIDGMVQSPKDFLTKYGWAPIGEECEERQIVIGTRTFAVHAALCETGFMAWAIFESTVSEREVKDFVTGISGSQGFSTDPNTGSFGIFDNASNQRTRGVREAMELVFLGHYMYCSPYSPELKPIENAFSVVKKYIQDHFVDTQDPEEQIKAAFRHYGRGTEAGYQACYHTFDLYRKNHQLYLDELIGRQNVG
jgi:hypothetical protein